MQTRCFYPRARGGRDSASLVFDDVTSVFLSTRPRGARLRCLSYMLYARAVSIHAPAGGATNFKLCDYVCSKSFYPRARGGRDLWKQWRSFALQMFLSTRPRGARHRYYKSCDYENRFYPRARGGRDKTKLQILSIVSLFLSTRPRGARLSKIS